MNETNNRKFVGRLIYAVLTESKSVREAIKLFPETKDINIECAYHALVHFAADEEMRYLDIEYREAQDDYLEVFLPDMAYSDTPIKKCISEDLADIYQDLKDFICVFQSGLNVTMNDSLCVCKEHFEELQSLLNELLFFCL